MLTCHRYHELLFMIDTCQANTMYSAFYTPNIIATGSSALHQSSYSHHADQDVGVAVIDRWTYYNLEFLEEQITSTSSNVTLGQLFDSYDPVKVHSDAGIRYDLFQGGESEARNRRVVDFFGNVQGVEVDAAKDNAEGSDWKADLEALRKIVDRQNAALRNETRNPVSKTKASNINTAEKPNILGVAGKSEKQAWGAAIVLGCVGLWGAVTWLDK